METKTTAIKYTVLLLFTYVIWGCSSIFQKAEFPTVPLFYYNFNSNCNNSGIDNFFLLGSKNIHYSKGIKDSCFNLSTNTQNRKPITIKHSNELMLNHYKGFSFVIWVKQNINSQYGYGIIGNKNIVKNKSKGWLMSTTTEGSWQFEISDGLHKTSYQATPFRQKLNDAIWHQLAFTYNKKQKEIRLYFDGINVAVLNAKNINSFSTDHDLMIGCDPTESNYSKNCFYGMLDEVGLWSRTLSAEEIKNAYRSVSHRRLPAQIQKVSRPFTVLNWNIWDGGTQMGTEAGPDQITEIIKSTKADIISLQDQQKTGAYIADRLNYYYYQASNQLCVISRYPITKTHAIYKAERVGVAELELSDNSPLYICPVLLTNQPNIRGLLMNDSAGQDSIIAIEEDSRAYEMKFILNELSRIAKKNASYIITADLNSGSHLDWTKDNKQNKYGKEIRFPATLLLEKKQFSDAYRMMYPNESTHPGNTYSPIFTEGYQDRLNYTFYKSSSLYPSKVEVINKSKYFFPSDHAALLTTFSSSN